MEISWDYAESIKNLDLIRKIDLNKKKSYKQVRALLNETILPFDILTLRKDMCLYRARKNCTNQEFHRQKEISYCHNKSKIKSYGRANQPKQALFYGSHKFESALFETSSLFPKKSVILDTEVITVGKWIVKQNIDLIAILSDKNAMTCDPEIQRLYYESKKHEVDPAAQIISEFFSKEFSKDCCENKNLYKISCALFNHLIEITTNKFFGVIYPSVANEYQDLNVALLPEVADNFLKLERVAEYKIDTIKETIFPIRYADKLINKEFILKEITEI